MEVVVSDNDNCFGESVLACRSLDCDTGCRVSLLAARLRPAEKHVLQALHHVYCCNLNVKKQNSDV